MAFKISGSKDGVPFTIETDNQDAWLQLSGRLLGIDAKLKSRKAKSSTKPSATRNTDDSANQARLLAVAEFAKNKKLFSATDAGEMLADRSEFSGVNATQVIQRLLRANTGEGKVFAKIGKKWTLNRNDQQKWPDSELETLPEEEDLLMLRIASS